MIFLEKIRISIGSFLLSRKLKSHKREVAVPDLTKIKSVGIIFDASNEAIIKTSKFFVSELQKKGIQLQALGYYKNHKKDDMLIGDKVYNYVSLKDFNWLFLPKNPIISEFTDQKFELLMVLYPHPDFPIHATSALSNAKFKVGKLGVDNAIFDFMLEIKKEDPDYFVEQAVHYLSIINQTA